MFILDINTLHHVLRSDDVKQDCVYRYMLTIWQFVQLQKFWCMCYSVQLYIHNVRWVAAHVWRAGLNLDSILKIFDGQRFTFIIIYT